MPTVNGMELYLPLVERFTYNVYNNNDIGHRASGCGVINRYDKDDGQRAPSADQ